MLRPNEITLELIRKTAQELFGECRDEKLDREDIYDRVFEWTDSAWGNWIRYGRIDEYDVADLVATAPGCCRILELATERNCVADDSGLWDGLTYGVLAAIAFHSLEQLIRDLLCAIAQEAGVDLDDDEPFAIPPCEQPDQLHARTTSDLWSRLYGVEYDEKTNRYAYPHGHVFSVGDICRIKELNEHGDPHPDAGVLVRIAHTPTTYKMTYTVTVHESTTKWPNRAHTSEIMFNEPEVNLERTEIASRIAQEVVLDCEVVK